MRTDRRDTEIRRNNDGSIDLDHYLARGRTIRSRAFRSAFRRLWARLHGAGRPSGALTVRV